MIKLKNLAAPDRRRLPMTTAECNALIEKSSTVDDEKSPNTSALVPFGLQFWVHLTMNSRDIDGVMHNDYTGRVCDGNGLYPVRRDHPMLTHDGYFKVHETYGLLPVEVEKDKMFFISGDIHRSTENRFLAAHHLLFHRIHNWRMDYHTGDYDKAREDTLAIACTFCRELLLEEIQMDESQMFSNVVVEDAVNTLECMLAIGRWAHTICPSKVLKKDIFAPVSPASIDLAKVKKEPARNMNFGVSKAMSDMKNQQPPTDIRKRTLNRSTEHAICDWGTAVDRYARVAKSDEAEALPKNLPLWAGMMLEAQHNNTGRLGPVGARMLADVAASTFKAEVGQGLWHTPIDAPSTIDEIIEYGST